jgi:hypothetical protein
MSTIIVVIKKKRVTIVSPNKKPGAKSLQITSGPIQEQNPMPISMSTTQETTLTATPLPKGSTVDGVPEWQLSNPAVVSIAPDATGLTALVKGTAIGACTVTVIADADLTPGVRNIQGTFDITVTAAEATSIEITASEPVPQP